jgi:chondroitin 4-sulfotransferase 11
MVINDTYKFLFVHIQKTAGISIRESLKEIKDTKNFYYPHYMINLVEEDLSEYFKFCFVRNPWDRLVSWYNMMQEKKIHNDFSEYILKNSNTFSEFLDLTDIIMEKNDEGKLEGLDYPKSISFNQLDYITDSDGIINVDFIGRFENINEDFKKVMKILQIKDNVLPHLNKFEHKPYRDYYKNKKDVEKVALMYKKDIEYFNYEF